MLHFICSVQSFRKLKNYILPTCVVFFALIITQVYVQYFDIDTTTVFIKILLEVLLCLELG